MCVCVCVWVCVVVCEQQEKAEVKRELWRIEDVIAGLSSSKANYQVTISSVTNPGERRPVPAPTHTHGAADPGTHQGRDTAHRWVPRGWMMWAAAVTSVHVE